MKWLKKGDCNTFFFHSLQKVKKTQCAISSLKVDGMVTNDKLTIKNHMLNYYMNLFTEDSADLNIDFNIIEDIIPCSVSLEDNQNLTTISSLEEVKYVVFALDPSNSLGPNDFIGLFFQTFWDIIHNDMTLAIQSFFMNDTITLCLNSNFMGLIPKT